MKQIIRRQRSKLPESPICPESSQPAIPFAQPVPPQIPVAQPVLPIQPTPPLQTPPAAFGAPGSVDPDVLPPHLRVGVTPVTPPQTTNSLPVPPTPQPVPALPDDRAASPSQPPQNSVVVAAVPDSSVPPSAATTESAAEDQAAAARQQAADKRDKLLEAKRRQLAKQRTKPRQTNVRKETPLRQQQSLAQHHATEADETPQNREPAHDASRQRDKITNAPRKNRANTAKLHAPAQRTQKQSARKQQDVQIVVSTTEESAVSEAVTSSVPSWLVSSVLHVLVVVVMSLLTLHTFSQDKQVFIEVSYADEENLTDEESDLPTLDAAAAEPVVLEQLPEVSDPMAAMSVLDPSFLGDVAPADLEAPAIGIALTGREKGMRQALVGRYGGTGATESSVEGGLAWLARYQQRDGSWSLQGPYPDGSPVENRAAATAMALLAFQGAGNTHQSGDYQQQVAHGWESLLKLQTEDGDFYQGDVPNQHLYTHGQATIAICELYSMTHDDRFREPAQHAVDFALHAQSPAGGWRYYPGKGSDTSVTGWYVMALQSALMAGLHVPPENLQRIEKYLDSVQLDDGSRYIYQPLQQPTPTMTAEGLLCRQYLGWDHDDSRLKAGVEYLLTHPLDAKNNYDVYYWYYASQVMHHMEGQPWERWNRVMRETVPKLQVTKGKERGSWDPKPDRWSHLGGRLYTTCLSIYMLEVYYRHLPIYSYRQ